MALRKEVRKELPTWNSREIVGHKERVLTVGWSSDGTRLASGSADKTAKVWSLDRLGNADSVELKGHEGDVDQLCWDPVHADLLATACTDKSIRIWDVRSAKSTQIKTAGENINVAWSPDGKHIAVGNKDDTISFIDPRGGSSSDKDKKKYIYHEIKYQGVEVNEISWDNSGELFFLTTGQGKIKVLDFKAIEKTSPENKEIYEFIAHNANCYSIDFDPRGRHFATGGADAIVCLWDLEDFACVRTFYSLEWPVRTISFSFDGEFLASGSEDNFIDISAVDTGETIHTVKCNAAMNSVAWHPSKYLLAYAGDDMENNGMAKGNVHVFGYPLPSV
ncbi:hypothetical protein HK097_001266 [Rhizophlyctis rosea]|uniref:THO complex subunit 3 n=1 Tax=Rhizophlyctis rosea TaxID=64517 RepID=A0AAD5S6C5_9FUNG|nr:hypothetical protein HK097_001266 [Rhizophlyctis rosea]